jgi:hypothetical protein
MVRCLYFAEPKKIFPEMFMKNRKSSIFAVALVKKLARSSNG